MRTIRKLAILEKRLFRKKVFIAALVLLPLMIAALRITAGSGNGVCHIVYFTPDRNDAYVKQIVKKFTGYSDIIDFRNVDSAELAKQMVMDKEADAAWIFYRNPKKIIEQAARNGRVSPVVGIYERKSNVMLKTAREVVCDSFFPEEAYYSYTGYIRNELGITRQLIPDSELDRIFQEYRYDGSMFEMYFPDGTSGEDYSYLMAPVRGIMAVWLMACAFIAVLYSASDEKNGVCSRIPVSYRHRERLRSEIVLMVTAMAVFVIALCCAGVFTNVGTEVLCLLFYAVSVLASAELVSVLCNDHMLIISVVMITAILISAVLAPVFVSVDLPVITKLIPANDYLRAIHSTVYIYRLAGYDAVVILCLLCAEKVKILLK